MKNVFELIEANGLTLHGDIEHFAELVRADEREAAEERVVDLFIDMETPYLLDITAAIQAWSNT